MKTIFLIISLFLLAAWIHGAGSGGGLAPVVSAATFTISTPVTNGSTVGTPTVTNSPTGCSITAGDPSGNFAVSSSCAITTTAAGVTNLVGLFATQTITVQATNSAGSGSNAVMVNGYGDGSVGAVAASVQFSNFFTSRALQSGQTYATRPPWRVAGVDYAVGVPSSVTLKDPSSVGLPSGCTYASNIVTCQSIAGLTYSGYDHSLHGGIALDLRATLTGSVTISNNNFVNGATSDPANFYMVTVDGGSANYIFQNNVCDGGSPTFFHVTGCIQYQSSGTYTGLYNACLHIGGHCFVSSSSGTSSEKFSYGEGMCYSPCAQHGEWQLLLFTGTMTKYTFDYNTFLEPAAVNQVALTTVVYLSGGSPNGSTITTAEVEYNTSAVNLQPGPGGTVTASSAFVEWSYINVGTTNLTSNYIDPTGAQFCFVDAGGGGARTTINYSGNTNLRDGSTILDANTSHCHGHG